MKQRATSRNKSAIQAEADKQVARRSAQPKFPRPPGLPRDVPFPRDQRTKDFLDGFVKLGTVKEAARLAGYTEETVRRSKNFYRTVDRYAEYIAHMRSVVETQVAKQLMVDGQTILDEIARIGLANEFDYLVFEVDEKTKKVKVRRKELHELSREDMVAIKITRGPNDTLAYDLRDKEPGLMALGKNLGLFNDKLIIEKRTVNIKARVDLSNVPMAELQRIIKQFESTVTESGQGRVLEAQ